MSEATHITSITRKQVNAWSIKKIGTVAFQRSWLLIAENISVACDRTARLQLADPSLVCVDDDWHASKELEANLNGR